MAAPAAERVRYVSDLAPSEQERHMKRNRLREIGGLAFIGGCALFVVGVFWLEAHKKRVLENRFDAVVQKVFTERNTASSSQEVQMTGSAEPIEFHVGKILPILVKDGKAKLSVEVLQDFPDNRRPATPEDAQTIVFINHVGSHESTAVFRRELPGTNSQMRVETGSHTSRLQDFELVFADITHPQLMSPPVRFETAAVLVEEVPRDAISEYISTVREFTASHEVP